MIQFVVALYVLPEMGADGVVGVQRLEQIGPNYRL